MKLIWNITKKDLRRMAGPLVGLVLVELIMVGIGLTLRAGNGVDFEWFGRMGMYLNLARVAQALVIFVLVGLLVHEDALVGMHVFWRTRPISNGMLLRSKLLTAVLIFGVLPIVIALPWWLVCGFGLRDMGSAALEMLGWSVCVVVPASALAVLSDNLGRYISLTVVGYAIGTFSLLMGIAYLPGQETTTWAVMQSRSVITLGLIVFGWLAIMTWQFRRRSIAFPYGILIILVIVTPLVMWGWSHDIFAGWRPRVADSSAETRGIKLTAGPANIGYSDGKATSLELAVRADGIPSGRVLASAAADLTWQARSGVLHANGFDLGPFGRSGTAGLVVRDMLGVANFVQDPETERWQLELRKRLPSSAVQSEPPLSPEEARKRYGVRFGLFGTAIFEPPVLKTAPEMRLDVVVARLEKMGELSLQPGDWLRMDRGSVRIVAVNSITRPAATNGMAAAFKEKSVHFISTGPGGEWIAPHWHLFHIGAPTVLATDCWLVSRELGIAYGSGSILAYSPSVRIYGVQIAWRTAAISEPRVIRNGIWTGYLPDWDRKFSLVFFSYPLEGQFRRTLKLEQVKDNRKLPEEPANSGS